MLKRNKNFNFNLETKTKYIQRCDFINRYLLTDLYAIPSITRVELKVSLEQLRGGLTTDLEGDEEDLKTRFFFIFFVLFGTTPFLKNIIIKQVQKRRRNSVIAENLFFYIRLQDKYDILNFLFYFHSYKLRNILGGRREPTWIFKEYLNENYTIKAKQPLVYLNNILYLLTTELLYVNLKHKNFYFKFFIQKNKLLLRYENAIKNVPFLRS